MNEEDFPPDVARGIVEHMNDDHADAVLAIARTQGGAPDATAAHLIAISPRALALEITVSGRTRRTNVVVDPPISPLDTVRARLVTMTRAAREALTGDPSA